MTDNINNKKLYPNPNQGHNLPNIEDNILNFWNSNNIFEKTISSKSNHNDFVFYDGPPFC